MITGIGIDIVELKRIQNITERQSKFPKRILTEYEYEQYNLLSSSRKIEFLAGRFAAKEAFAKAYGTGIGRDLSFLDMEVKKDNNGKPFFVKPLNEGVHLAISHSRNYAVANVVIEKE